MAPKKFTYTPGTGGGKQTKALAKKGALSKKDQAALDAWAKSQQARGAFGPVTGTAKPGSTSSKVNIGTMGLGKGGVAGMRTMPTSTKDFTPKRLKKSVPFALEGAGIPVEEVSNIVKGKGSKADYAIAAMSVIPGMAGKAVKPFKAGLKAGKVLTAAEKATVKAGKAKGKTAEMAVALEKQGAKESSSKSVFQAPESTVKPLAPAPAGAKMPTGMTKAEIKKFGAKRAKDLGTGGKSGRTAKQQAQVASDIEETIKSQLAARQTGARAGAEIPGELGARRVGGPAADAATAAPVKPKAAPKPGPKQALRENARLTAEPTGKPKVPSARASQAVKDKYAKDLAAYEKKQATFEKQQAAIKQKTTDIEMGKAKGPSARETGKPMVKTGPAKEVKKPRATKPKVSAAPVTSPAPAAAKPAPRPASMKAPTKAEAKSTKFSGNMKATSKAPTEAAKAPGLIKRLAAKKPGFMKSKTFKAASATAAAAGGALGVGGAIVGQAPGSKSGKTTKAKKKYQAGNGMGMFSIAQRNKARSEQAAAAAKEKPTKKFGAAGESKFIKGRSAVRQSVIDQINKQGMTKSLAEVKSRKNDPEYLEAIRRYYGAKRLKQALKG